LSPDKFVIPRLIRTSFDLEPKPVCNEAAKLLRAKYYLKLTTQHPQVSQQPSLYKFMLSRRRLHKLFDGIRCEQRYTWMDKNLYSAEKNLVLQECYVTTE
jgi:hypothetical protein